MEEFFSNIVSSIGFNDILDILITTFVIYKVMEFIKNSRAQQLMKGLLILIAAYFISGFLNLHVVHWLLESLFTVGLFALVVLFQPELRRGLEHMGRSKIGRNHIINIDKDRAKRISDEVSRAASRLSAGKTGALIVFEGEITLEDIAETGTVLNADITEELLENIFYEGSPLHDGAVIIRQDKIYTAGCVLPLTENNMLNKSLGTRHRAALGITENSDALALVVSEETGVISIAENGEIRRNLERKDVSKAMLNLFTKAEEEKKPSALSTLSQKLGRGRHAAK